MPNRDWMRWVGSGRMGVGAWLKLIPGRVLSSLAAAITSRARGSTSDTAAASRTLAMMLTPKWQAGDQVGHEGELVIVSHNQQPGPRLVDAHGMQPPAHHLHRQA